MDKQLYELNRVNELFKTETTIKNPWCKLTKTIKINKLKDYAIKYKTENELSTETYENLLQYLENCLSTNKLLKNKDVNYDIKLETIIDIPVLQYLPNVNRFTIKNVEKKKTTIKKSVPKK